MPCSHTVQYLFNVCIQAGIPCAPLPAHLVPDKRERDECDLEGLLETEHAVGELLVGARDLAQPSEGCKAGRQ